MYSFAFLYQNLNTLNKSLTLNNVGYEVINIIKVLILYYLSIKPTHGYEIQKFMI